MKKELEFYVCELCGNLVELAINGGGDLSCCGQPMKKLEANTTDAAGEKHVPVVEVDGQKVVVKVGSVLHPMEEKHHISFVYLVTEKAVMRVDLEVGKDPIAEFTIAEDDKVVAAYEYCNLHGLWKVEL